MDFVDLERLGLNKNEAKVYLGLLQLNKASAADLVKKVGVHRNIIYDNLEKLIEKGLVSFVEEEGKKLFIAEDPQSIIEFLEAEKSQIDKKITNANSIIPQIAQLLTSKEEASDVKVFRGVWGVKSLLTEILNYKENWCLGMANESVEVIGEIFWKNYNAKIKDKNIKEKFLLNEEFEDTHFFEKNPNIQWRKLPKELSQNIEIIMFGEMVSFFIYEKQPSAILIKDKSLFKLFMNQFNYLWRQANASRS